MRKLGTIIIVAAAVAGGFYSYYWFSQAEKLKASVEQSIRQMNEQAKYLNNNKDLVTYQSINISGFPFSMQADFHNAVVDVPVSALIQQNNPGDDKFKNIPVLLLEITYKDRISVSGNLMADDFAMTIYGEQSVRPIINNESRPALVSSSNAPTACHLVIANQGGMPWKLPAAFADAHAFLHAFRSFECNAADMVTRYGDSPDIISSLQKFAIAASLDGGTEAKRKARLTAEMLGARSSGNYDQVLNSYLQIFYDVMQVPAGQRTDTINTVQYGTQNSRIDLGYEGPVEKKYLGDPALSISLDVNALDVKNDLYTSENRAHIGVYPAADNQIDASVSLHSTSEFNEKYEQVLAKQLAQTLRQLAQGDNAQVIPPLVHAIAAQNQSGQVAAALVPKLHAMGKISLDVDINAKGNKNLMAGGSITINAFDITTGKYGIKTRGNGSAAQGKPPLGELLVTCLVCDQMAGDIGDYSINADTVLAHFRQPPMVYVSKPLVDGVVKFLHGINEKEADKTSQDIVIHLLADDKAQITISGKQILEVVGLFSATIAPYLQPQPLVEGTATTPAASAGNPVPENVPVIPPAQ